MHEKLREWLIVVQNIPIRKLQASQTLSQNVRAQEVCNSRISPHHCKVVVEGKISSKGVDVYE